MVMRYEYDIDNIKVYSQNGLDNIVHSYRFTIIGSENGVYHKSFFPVELNSADPSNFVQYSDLNKQDMIDWTINVVGQFQIDSLKNGIKGIVKEKANLSEPVIQSAEAPWSN